MENIPRKSFEYFIDKKCMTIGYKGSKPLDFFNKFLSQVINEGTNSGFFKLFGF
jgi:hypothetical protein